MVKRKLDGAVDEFSVEKQIHISDATVKNQEAFTWQKRVLRQ